MDKRERAIDVVRAINEYKANPKKDYLLVEKVCAYFDLVKNSKLSQADLQFLKQISNIAGIPHYFDHLTHFQKEELNINDITLNFLSSLIHESSLHTSDDKKVHRYQKQILDKFELNKQNRYFLSASTSFGKTHLVFEIIQKIKYKNIVLIFPTIALLSENLERLLNNNIYADYKLHTLSDVPEDQIGPKNIFIYTPERFLSFIEKHRNTHRFDFVFIDEVYKIDNEYIIEDEEAKESERDVSYRIAAFYTIMHGADILLAGPYIEKYSNSFERFLSDNQILKLEFNQYEIVGKSYHDIKTKKTYKIDNDIVLDFGKDNKAKAKRLIQIVQTLSNAKSNCIIYCYSKSDAAQYAKILPSLLNLEEADNSYKNFLNHVMLEYGKDWVVSRALEKGIGIHHGLVPKYMQKEIIKFFNDGIIKVLTSTTTITEGINTSAKNLIVTHNKKGDKPLKKFDAKNIAGRAGRFDRHYSGRVIVLQNDFMKDINQEAESINHKNYDSNSKKDEIDLFYSKEEFLSNDDKTKKESIKQRQEQLNIPDYIFDIYKVISRQDKMDVYENICKFTTSDHAAVQDLIQRLSYSMSIEWNGFEIVLNSIKQTIRNKNLSNLIEQKTNSGKGPNSILTVKVSSYLERGFKGLIEFDTQKRNPPFDIDRAMSETTRFVYDTLKYQLVKHLGVFNIMYKFYLSRSEGKNFDDIAGIDRLLTKLEYNALSDIGRRASDYGVPDKILRYYEENDKGSAASIKQQFDSYENMVFERVKYMMGDKN